MLASIFLLPSTLIAFGVSSMVFAAYEFVQKRAERKGRQKGQQEGQQAERERIRRELKALVGDGSTPVSDEDIERITRPDGE